MRLFILAGEPSGDRLASDLISRLREKVSLDLIGVGGTELQAEGLKTMFPMRELSVMGADILPRLPWLLFRAWQVARKIIQSKPDVVVLVDSQIFSAVVARQVRNAGVTCPMFLYVAPSVWASGPERAKKLVPLFDEVLAVLPFEPKVMEKLEGPPTHYVGHPALRRLTQRPAPVERGPLLLLPGSREGELRRHLPLMKAVAIALVDHPRVSGLVLPTLVSLEQRIAAEVETWPVPVTIASGVQERSLANKDAVAACVVMGTATLELALSGVPMVGVYSFDTRQEKLWRDRMGGLPNIVLGRRVMPEYMRIAPEPEELVAAVRTLLDGDATRQQAEAFVGVRELMENGEAGSPLADPVERILAHLH